MSAGEIAVEKLKRIKNHLFMTEDVKQPRNYGFHKKAFALIDKAFEYWCADKTDQRFMCEEAQFNKFREDLTVQAGYYKQVFDLNGKGH